MAMISTQTSFVDTQDPDMFDSSSSPRMTALRPKLELTPSPTLELSRPHATSPFPSDNANNKINKRGIEPTPADQVLVSYLANHSNQDVAATAGTEVLPDDEEGQDDEDGYEFCEGGAYATSDDVQVVNNEPIEDKGIRQPVKYLSGSLVTAKGNGAPTDLQQVAAEACGVIAREPTSPGSIPRLTAELQASTSQLNIKDEWSQSKPSPLAFAREPLPASSPRPLAEAKSPRHGLPGLDVSGELPPLQIDTPHSDFGGRSLPSISSQLGDIKTFHTDSAAFNEGDRYLPQHSSSFPLSPQSGKHRLPPLSRHHASPPMSPQDHYSRSIGSPPSVSTPLNSHFLAGGIGPWSSRASTDYTRSNTADTLSVDLAASTPATSTASVADPMSLDSLSNPAGTYVCTEPGCQAQPFQTQYLLNSHANVHSSARPHYCPVRGCPRSEAGKGFKRKNEMIRHGLVHESPGYICPFCPDREHKYPRPDNLQRHVRVHHVDRDKDDPLLRQVLAQRADGPSRGRRRRGTAS